MITRVIRERSFNTGTFGVVMVDDRFFGFCLEDVVREKSGHPVDTWKIPGVTAIPAGKYRLTLSLSNRFKRVMPEVQNVTGFAGIRIHAGNVAADTEGCLLFGKQRDDLNGKVLLSRIACDEYQALLAAAINRKEPCWLTVENVPASI
jgi:hypothetical protein